MCFRKITAARGVQSRLEIQSKFGGLAHGLETRRPFSVPCNGRGIAFRDVVEASCKLSKYTSQARPDEREAMITTGVVQAPRQAPGWRSWFVGKCDELS